MEQFNRYFLDTLKYRYAEFSGRASRSEFWYYVLFYVLGSILFAILDSILGTTYTYEFASAQVTTGGADIAAVSTKETIGYLQTFYGFAMLIPSIAVSIRRLHDTGKSGWWFLLGVIPIVNFIGIFVLIYFYVQEGQAGSNAYGPDPRELQNHV